MTTKTIRLTPALYDYILSVSLREHPVLRELRAATAKLATRKMQIAPEQGQFMALLVELIGARKTLELGVYTGYSALVVALSLPADGKVVACEISDSWREIAESHWQKAGVRSKIDFRIAPALTTLEALLHAGEANSFDFAFIDADKRQYPIYFEKVLQLIRPGGLIVLDNVLRDGRVADTTVQDSSTQIMRDLNKKLLHDERVHISLVPIGDGLLLARKC